MTDLIQYDNALQLTEAMKAIPVRNSFIIDTFFDKQPIFHNDFDIKVSNVTYDTNLASFTGRHSEPKRITDNDVYSVLHLTVPHTFEEFPISTEDLRNFDPMFNPNVIGNKEDLIKNANSYLLTKLELIKRRAYDRREEMAIQIATTGKFVYDDNENIDINLGFKENEQIFTLTGTDLWTAKEANILGSIEGFVQKIIERTGNAPSKMIIGKKVWDAIASNATLMKLMDTKSFVAGSIDLTVKPRGSVYFKGILGTVEVWVYRDIKFPEDRILLLNDTLGYNRLNFVRPTRFTDNNKYNMSDTEIYMDIISNTYKTNLAFVMEQNFLPTINPAGVVTAKVV